MLNPHGWKDYRYRMLYTNRAHLIHANVTSTTTACPRRWMRREESPRHSAQPRLRTPDMRLRLHIPEAQRGKGEGHVEGDASCTHAKTNKQKKPNPKSMTKTVCVLSLESSHFPLVFSPVSCFSSTGPEGTFPSGKGRWMDRGRRSGPSLSSHSLAHCSVSHQLLWPSPYRHAPVAFASILPGVRGRERVMEKGSVAISCSCW